MEPTYPAQGHGSTYSRDARSRSGSGVSTTEGLLQDLRLAEVSLFETGSYASSRPPSSQGLASPAYLSPGLSHTPGSHLPTPLSQHHHQQPFPPFPSDASVSHTEWFQGEQTRAQATPLLRIQPAHNQFGPPTSSPPVPSIEADTMRYLQLSRVAHCLPISPGSLAADSPGTVPSPLPMMRPFTWAPDQPSLGQVRPNNLPPHPEIAWCLPEG